MKNRRKKLFEILTKHPSATLLALHWQSMSGVNPIDNYRKSAKQGGLVMVAVGICLVVTAVVFAIETANGISFVNKFTLAIVVLSISTTFGIPFAKGMVPLGSFSNKRFDAFDAFCDNIAVIGSYIDDHILGFTVPKSPEPVKKMFRAVCDQRIVSYAESLIEMENLINRNFDEERKMEERMISFHKSCLPFGLAKEDLDFYIAKAREAIAEKQEKVSPMPEARSDTAAS